MKSDNKGWTVTLAGTGINLALGVLYSWSVIAKSLIDKWGWTSSEASLPYAVAVGVFAVVMVFAGRAQDKIGPRIVASIGGAMTGLGLIVASLATNDNNMMIIIGFGILAGTGIGLGYASATPAAIKWFPKAKKGMITGIVVSGFGLASIYIAPTTENLLKSFGINRTFLVLGLAFFVVTVLLSQLLKNPPAGYVPKGEGIASNQVNIRKHEYDWHEMMRTPQFYLIWLMYACVAFAGLMIIGHMAKIAVAQMPSVNLGFLLVAFLAVGNASGRIIAGSISDKLGRPRTMLLVFLFQALMMIILPKAFSSVTLIISSMLIGFNYGANLALFPSITGDYFGNKNFGVNYGLVFTAWGVGGVFGSMTAGKIVDATGSYGMAYVVAGSLCVVAAAMTFLAKEPKEVVAKHPIVETVS